MGLHHQRQPALKLYHHQARHAAHARPALGTGCVYLIHSSYRDQHQRLPLLSLESWCAGSEQEFGEQDGEGRHHLQRCCAGDDHWHWHDTDGGELEGHTR